MSKSMARWSVALLIVAIAPSILYVGHWEPRIDIPFTSYYWGIPESWQSAGGSHDDESHAEHCHGDSSCTERPVTAGAGVALLRDDLEMLGAAGLLRAVFAAVRSPHLPGLQAPETPPPRRAVLAG